MEEKILAEETARMDPANVKPPAIIQTIDLKLATLEKEYLVVLKKWKKTASPTNIKKEKDKLEALKKEAEIKMQKEIAEKNNPLNQDYPSILQTIDLKIVRYTKEIEKVNKRIEALKEPLNYQKQFSHIKNIPKFS